MVPDMECGSAKPVWAGPWGSSLPLPPAGGGVSLGSALPRPLLSCPCSFPLL